MKRSPTLEMKYVPHLGEVGCGRAIEAFDNVIPFAPKSELFPVALPVNVAAQDVGIVTVRGLSLSDFNIFDGDRLVIKKKFTWREIQEDTICVVLLHSTGELVAKRVSQGANKLILRASGGGLKDIECSPDEVEIKAVVLDVLIDVRTQIARARDAKRRTF